MKDIKPYDENSQKHGLWKKYHSTGKLGSTGRYVNGEREGLWYFYYSSGELAYFYTFRNGEVRGLHRQYNFKGDVVRNKYFIS